MQLYSRGKEFFQWAVILEPEERTILQYFAVAR
jgi:hypothetical protein